MSDILAFGDRKLNAELMYDCYRLGYLDGKVLDTTYGSGRFWTWFRPDLTTNSFIYDYENETDIMSDFCNLPFKNGAFNSVVFDPPYKLNGTTTGAGPSSSDDSYGVGGKYVKVKDKMNLIMDGAVECGRVASNFLLVKCQDQVCSGKVVWQTRLVSDLMEKNGEFVLKDMLFVQGHRKQSGRQLHARRDYSTLLVFKRTK